MSAVVYVVTHPMTARLLLQGQLRYMKQAGFDVTVISSAGPDLEVVRERENVPIITIPLQREISPLKDIIALIGLYRTLRKLKPDVVNAGTPKAGLLGMIAARLAGVPVRIYTLRGLRLQTKPGLLQKVLRLTEKIASSCATRVLCVSESLRQRYLDMKLAPTSKLAVLGKGSSNGLNLDRFPETVDRESTGKLRNELQIPADAPVIGFVGRFTRDKGIAKLLEAFDYVVQKLPRARLLLVGDFEAGDPLSEQLVKRIGTDPRIVTTGYVGETAPYYRLMDVMAFPSYREGFPNAVLEAAACCVPVVGFRVTGVMDAVEDGVTGRLVDFGNVPQFAEALSELLDQTETRRVMGSAGRARVIRDFQQSAIWEAIRQEYDDQLRNCRTNVG